MSDGSKKPTNARRAAGRHGGSAGRAAGGSGARTGGGGSPMIRRGSGPQSAGPASPPSIFDPTEPDRTAARPARTRGDSDRLPVRLFLGTLVATGVVGACWILGAVGHGLGFAMAMRVPDLDTGGVRALSTGVMMLVDTPGFVLQAGIAQPFWLLAAFFLLSIPAAGLAAAEPRRPGAPPPNEVYAAIANLAAVGAMLTTAGLLWWTSSPVRQGLMRPMPLTDATDTAAWTDDVATAAGLDILAVVGLALWVVLVFRLPVAGWLRALSASVGCFGLVVVGVAMAISAATASQIQAQRSAIVTTTSIDDGIDPAAEADADTRPVTALLLGRAGEREAILVPGADGLEVRLRTPPSALRVVGRISIAEIAREASGG